MRQPPGITVIVSLLFIAVSTLWLSRVDNWQSVDYRLYEAMQRYGQRELCGDLDWRHVTPAIQTSPGNWECRP